MTEPLAKIQVQNPALIASFTPVASTLPVTLVNVNHPIHRWAIVAIVCVVIVYLALVFFIVRLGLKKTNLLLKTDGLQFSNRHVSLEQIVFIKYNRKNRYLQVKTRPAIRGFHVYLGKKDEIDEKVVLIENWVKQTSVSYHM